MTDIGAYPYGVTPPVIGNRFTNTPGWVGWDTLPNNEWVKVEGDSPEVQITALLNSYSWAGSRRWEGGVVGSFHAWVGAAVDQDGGNAYIPWGGGHTDSSLNGIWKLDLEAMEWSLEDRPSDPDQPGFEWSYEYWNVIGITSYTTYTPAVFSPTNVLPDDRPTSSHGYSGYWFDSLRRTLNTSRGAQWAYNIDTKQYTKMRMEYPAGTNINPTIYHSEHYDYIQDRIVGGYTLGSSAFYKIRWQSDPDSNVVEFKGLPSGMTMQGLNSCADIVGRKLYVFSPKYINPYPAPGTGYEQFAICDLDTGVWSTVELTTGSTYDYSKTYNEGGSQICAYVPEWGKILRRHDQYPRGQWYIFDPATNVNTPWTPPTTNPSMGTDHPCSKCFYYAKRNSVVYINAGGVWVMKCVAGM